MKMRQRPEPTSEDNRETMGEIKRQLTVVRDSQINSVDMVRERECLLDFICEVLEAKDAAAKVDFCLFKIATTKGIRICGFPAEGTTERCPVHQRPEDIDKSPQPLRPASDHMPF